MLPFEPLQWDTLIWISDAGENDLRVAVTGGQVCGHQNSRRQNGWHLHSQTADVDCSAQPVLD